jgi:hypothetical protein
MGWNSKPFARVRGKPKVKAQSGARSHSPPEITHQTRRHTIHQGSLKLRNPGFGRNRCISGCVCWLVIAIGGRWRRLVSGRRRSTHTSLNAPRSPRPPFSTSAPQRRPPLSNTHHTNAPRPSPRAPHPAPLTPHHTPPPPSITRHTNAPQSARPAARAPGRGRPRSG